MLQIDDSLAFVPFSGDAGVSATDPISVRFPVHGASRIVQSPRDGLRWWWKEPSHTKPKGNENAIDIEAEFGQTVVASIAGRVAHATNDLPDFQCRPGVSGNNVVVVDAQGREHYFGHLKQGSVRVMVGQVVVPGQPIAEVGLGDWLYHLHYEVRALVGAEQHSVPVRFLGCRSEDAWEPSNGPVQCPEHSRAPTER